MMMPMESAEMGSEEGPPGEPGEEIDGGEVPEAVRRTKRSINPSLPQVNVLEIFLKQIS